MTAIPFHHPSDGPITIIVPGALRRKNAAPYCDIPLRTWDEMRAKGQLPKPIVDNGTAGVTWLREHLDLWNEWGRPSEERFEFLLNQHKPQRRRRAG